MRHDDVRPLDRDKLFMVPQLTAAAAAHEALFPLQALPPEDALAGIAVLFVAFTARCGVDPQDLHTFGARLLRDRNLAEDKVASNSLMALRDFAGLRFMGQDVSIG